jgi:hypothetical protein
LYECCSCSNLVHNHCSHLSVRRSTEIIRCFQCIPYNPPPGPFILSIQSMRAFTDKYGYKCSMSLTGIHGSDRGKVEGNRLYARSHGRAFRVKVYDIYMIS